MHHENDALCDLLNEIADQKNQDAPAILRKALLDLGETMLKSSDGWLRASSARALMSLAPEDALRLIPEALAREPHMPVARVMRGALNAAIQSLRDTHQHGDTK